jgi:hypothetical protein
MRLLLILAKNRFQKDFSDSVGIALPRTLRKRELRAPGCPFFVCIALRA